MMLCQFTNNGRTDNGITGRERKNVVILSLSFTAVFTAYLAVQNLQSSLNQEKGLGIISLSCIYAFIIVSSVLAPSIIKLVGIKISLIVSWATHVLYTACNFYPTFATLIPSSILLGLISGPLWTSQSVFITSNAYSVAKHEQKDIHAVLSKFNGIFFAMYETTQITGNLISSLVLNQGSYDDNDLANTTKHCGASDCPGGSGNSTEIAEPEREIVYILLSIFLVFDLAGLILTVVFLPAVAKTEWSKECSTKDSVTSCFSTLSDPTLLLLIPLIALMAMEQAVLWTDFTKSFISCPFGVKMVGFVMASYGGSTTTSAIITSRLAKYTGRHLLFGIAMFINMAVFVVMYVWTPDPDKTYIIFLIAIFWGISEGIWQTQSNALIALLFPEKTEPAFANYHCWKAASFTVYFVISNYLCVSTKLIVAMATLSIAAILYVIVEVRVRFKKPSYQIE